MTHIPTFEEYARPKIREKVIQNYKEIMVDINKVPIPEWLNTKIENRIDKYWMCSILNNTREQVKQDIIEKIKNDQLYAFEFMKDDGRQGLWEKYQLAHINEYRNAHAIKLKSSGPNAIYLDNGKFVKGKKPKDGTKSLDFKDFSTE